MTAGPDEVVVVASEMPVTVREATVTAGAVTVVTEVVVVREVPEPPTVITLIEPINLTVVQSGPLVEAGPQGPPGIPGPQGPQGATGSTGEADDIIRAGQPVYVKATGHLGVASSTALPYAGYAGVALADTAVGFAAPYGVGVVMLTDWTFIAGTATITPGAVYYLGNGTITTVAPSTGYCVVVGRALTPTTLHAYQEPSILL